MSNPVAVHFQSVWQLIILKIYQKDLVTFSDFLLPVHSSQHFTVFKRLQLDNDLFCLFLHFQFHFLHFSFEEI